MVSIDREPIAFGESRIFSDADSRLPALRAGRALLERIRDPLAIDPWVSGYEGDSAGSGIDNYDAAQDAADGSAVECLRIPVPPDAQCDFQRIATAKLGGAQNAEWKFALTYARNGKAAPAPMQATADPITSTGSNANAPPAGWDATIAIAGNDVVVSVTTEANTSITVGATVFTTLTG